MEAKKRAEELLAPLMAALEAFRQELKRVARFRGLSPEGGTVVTLVEFSVEFITASDWGVSTSGRDSSYLLAQARRRSTIPADTHANLVELARQIRAPYEALLLDKATSCGGFVVSALTRYHADMAEDAVLVARREEVLSALASQLAIEEAWQQRAALGYRVMWCATCEAFGKTGPTVGHEQYFQSGCPRCGEQDDVFEDEPGFYCDSCGRDSINDEAKRGDRCTSCEGRFIIPKMPLAITWPPAASKQ